MWLTVSDDIVTRLREQAVCTRSECDDCDLHRNAADEIETLRNKLAEQEIIHAVQKKNTMTEIERLRAELDVYRERNAWVERHE